MPSSPSACCKAHSTGWCSAAPNEKDIKIVRVPGAFEIPSAARTLAETKKYDAIICIGCLLRGDTAHYDVIVNEVARGIGQSAQETGVPHAFGVLTCENLEQAIDRAGLKMGNKGFEAALAAVEMANLKAVVGRQSSVVSKSQKRKANYPRRTRSSDRLRPFELHASCKLKLTTEDRRLTTVPHGNPPQISRTYSADAFPG